MDKKARSTVEMNDPNSRPAIDAKRDNMADYDVIFVGFVNYIGFHDKGMLLAGGCGDTNGKPQIDKTSHLAEAYEFGKSIYM